MEIEADRWQHIRYERPAERVASAQELAERAEALLGKPARRNDSTRVMPVLPDEPIATTVIDLAEPLPEKPALVWPWIALIVALIITGVSLIVAMLSKPNVAPSPSPSQSQSATPSSSATPTPSDTPTTPQNVVVLSTEVLGVNKDQVQVALEAKGLIVNAIAGTALQTGDPRINTVYEATPLGSMPEGTVITLTYYVEETTANGTGG